MFDYSIAYRVNSQGARDFEISRSVRSRYILVSLTTAFCCAKCANVMRKCDTASLPCIMRSSPRNLQRARSAKSPAERAMRTQTQNVPRNALRSPQQSAFCSIRRIFSRFVPLSLSYFSFGNFFLSEVPFLPLFLFVSFF